MKNRNNHSRRRIVYPPLGFLLVALALVLLTRCTFGFDPNASTGSGGNTGGDTARVLSVVDGDTIDIDINGQRDTVRYIGVNTPERGEACYNEATQANRIFVEGQTVRLVADREDRDRFGRMLRYVYVGSLFVNRAMIEQGYGEAVAYEPNVLYFSEFSGLEQQARASNRGCHPTSIFNDGNDRR
jgi:endonuclease YncB( thermonuclease family)